MRLGDWHAAVSTALAAGAAPAELARLAGSATQMAEMVGWASAAIDPRGEVLAALEALRQSTRERFEARRDNALAALHDAIAELMDAIARHDRDLDPRQPVAEDLVEL